MFLHFFNRVAAILTYQGLLQAPHTAASERADLSTSPATTLLDKDMTGPFSCEAVATPSTTETFSTFSAKVTVDIAPAEEISTPATDVSVKFHRKAAACAALLVALLQSVIPGIFTGEEVW